MDRQIVYIGQSPQDTDLLLTNLNAYIGIAKLSAAIFGTSTLFNSLVCAATSPASMNVSVGAGEIYSLQNIDDTTYGSIPANTTYQILKQGINLAATTLACPAPVIVGNSINYLVQIGFSELGAGSVVLPYYDSANPSMPFTGPNNNPVPQYTIRQDTANVAVKAGTPAPTGTQTTPSPDAGFTGAYVVTVAYGQTTITSSSISIYAGAPFLTETLLQKLGIADLQSGASIYSADTGSANAYVATLTPAITAYSTGMKLSVKIANANTTTSTLNVNGLGAKTIKYTSGSNIIANDLLVGMLAQFEYDGTNFQLLNPASEDAGGILGVPEGGTGKSSATAYALIAGGTTTTGAFQSVTNGASGTMLQGAGTSALPTYSTATWPTTTTVNQILYSSSANTVAGLSTANNGVLVTSNTGVPSILAGPGTTGNMLQSNAAAAPSFSTASWPSTTTINQILYSSSANTVAGITTAVNGVLITSAGGVPSISSTLPSGITLVAPVLGTPASGVLTNCTGLPVAGGGTGLASTPAYAVLCGGTTTTGPLQSIASVGSLNNLLASNGAGALPTMKSFSTLGIITQVTKQVFTGSGTYTPTSGMVYCIVEGIGGGGGGAGTVATGTTANSGSGGGSGGYGKVTLTAAQIGVSKAVTIGAAGTAGTAGNNAGGNGGATSLGTLLQVGGGGGGPVGAASSSAVVFASVGGTAGSTTTGDFLIGGVVGCGSFFSGASGVVSGGKGADSHFGPGGVGSLLASANAFAGNSGTGYGSGGSGGTGYLSTTSVAGGAGTAGIIVITEFIAT